MPASGVRTYVRTYCLCAAASIDWSKLTLGLHTGNLDGEIQSQINDHQSITHDYPCIYIQDDDGSCSVSLCVFMV